MMRDLERDDLVVLDEIHARCHQSFPPPELSNLIDDKIITDKNGDIIGYGMLKLFPEAIMILDTAKPLRDRVEALNEFMVRAIGVSAQYGQIHAFVNDEKFSHLLIERYQFRPVRDKALVLNLGGE